MSRLVACALTFALLLAGVVATRAEAAKSKPDLVVSAVSAPSSASPSVIIIVSDTVKNQGAAAAKAFTVAYYLSTNASDVTGASLLGTQSVSSLSAGASVALVNSLNIPGPTASGTFYVVVVADSTNAIGESSESNNTRASGAITVTDVTPPTISAVTTSGITASSATIAWTTNELSTSQVEYGLTTAYGSMSTLDTSKVTSRGVTVNGLAVSTLYHFRVRSTDTAGNTALSSDYTFTTTASTGRTYYVATAGSDANPGTAAYPFRTLSHGVSVLAPGDTLYVRGGTYAEAVHDIPSGTSWSTPVTVAAYPGETATVQPGATGWPAVYLYDRSYIVLDGLIFDGSNIGTSYYTIIDIGGPSHHIRIQNGEVAYSPMQGIYIGVDAVQNEATNMHIHDNGTTDFHHGLYITGSQNLVEGNDIYRNAGWGVHIYTDAGANTANGNIVRNNRIHDNARVGQRGAGIILSSGNGNMAYNNLIWGNASGIQIAYGTPTDSEVYNNTIYANRDYGIRIDPDGTRSVVENNILYQNGTGYYGTQFSNVGSGTQQSNNLIGGDPKFVDVLAHDFHLQSGSPAIDQGVVVAPVTTDFDGASRLQGATTDIGAFEFIYQ